MQHILIDGVDGNLVRVCDDLAGPDARRSWRDIALPTAGTVGKLRARFLLRMASRSANVAGNDDRCGGCSIFARVCGSVGWGWEDERALDSPYYVLEGTELRQCPSLEKAREAADAYRKSGAEGLERVRRAGVASWIREAVTAASVASVCVKIGEDQLVPIDELIGILAEDRRLLATLTPREEQVIRMRFGIERATCDTLEEIAKQLDVTRERVREIEAKALRKLGMGGRGGKIKALREQKFC